MPSSQMERYIRKIDVSQLAKVRAANEKQEEIHSNFITSGWFSYNDPMHKYSKHYEPKSKNKGNKTDATPAPVAPKQENCTKSQKFHFLYHKTFNDQGENRSRNSRNNGENDEQVVMLLQVPTHEEFFHRDQMTEDQDQKDAKNTNREQILEWYGKSFGAALTASLNNDVVKNAKQGSRPGNPKEDGPRTPREEEQAESPWPIGFSQTPPVQKAKKWYDEERRRESLILERELCMHVLGAYKTLPKTPKTPTAENPFLSHKNSQFSTSIIPNESKRRGHRRSYWRRSKANVVTSLRTK